MKFKTAKWLYATITVALICIFCSNPVLASSVSYYLDQNNINLPTANYLKVTISDSDDITGNIDFEVEVLKSAFPTPLLSNFGMDNFYFNYEGGSFSGSIDNLDPNDWDILFNANAGGVFGTFEIHAKGDGQSRTSLLTFSISGVADDTPNTYAVANPELSDGKFFAAHVADFTTGMVDENGKPVTSGKFAGSTPVPLPAPLLLLGTGLIGLFGVRRSLLKP